MGFDIQSILGENLASAFTKMVGMFKLSPEKKAEMQEAINANQAIIQEKQIDLQSKLSDQLAREVEASAEVIKAEATSQSWLPRNVRPLLLLLWGVLITMNYLMGIVAQFTSIHYVPQTLPDWLYKLTAIGYTGYVGFRTWEKLKDADN